MGVIVNKKGLAELFGRSPRWVDTLLTEGLPIVSGGGKGRTMEIDTEVALKWIIQYEINKRLGGDDDEDDEDGNTDEDRALKRTRRKKIELEIDQIKKTLLPFDVVESIVFSIANAFGRQLDSLPSRLAGDLAIIDEPPEIRQLIFNETRNVRRATAAELVQLVRGLREQVFGFVGDCGDDGGCATGEEFGPMGD